MRLSLVLLLSLGCAKKTPAPVVVPAEVAQVAPEGCPGPDDPAFTGYGADPAVGLSLEQPLQWGTAADGALWYGRLVCPQGAAPRIHRVQGHSSDSSGVLVDEWSVVCPGFDGEERWFSTVERCQMSDPPSDLWVMSSKAATDLAEVATERRFGDALKALRLAEDVAQDFPDLQAAHLAVLWTAVAARDVRRAERALNTAMDFGASDLRLVVMAALVHVRQKDFAAAEAVLDLPLPTDELDRQVLLCAQGRLAFLQGDRTAALAKRDEACGETGACCKDVLATLSGQ